MQATSLFSKPLILALSFAFFIAPSIVYAADKPIDYQLQGKVYQWYGHIDQPSFIIPKTVKLDYGEYENASRSAGAHHILTITPEGIEGGKQAVEVELEYLAQPQSGKDITGQYVIQRLIFDVQKKQIVSSKTELNEYDDFTSNYRDANHPNLIKAFIYQWTDHLDKLSEGQQIYNQNLLTTFNAETFFEAEERNVSSANQYLNVIAKQDYKDSRRAIKNLNIQMNKDTGFYTASFEYVWNALNHDGENELAQMGVEIEIEFINGNVHIRHYKAKYLPPVTDLGAEIRC